MSARNFICISIPLSASCLDSYSPKSKIGDWMAVAYENGWFLEHVLWAGEETEAYYTNFLHPCFHCRTVQTPSVSRPGRCEEDLHLRSADPVPTSGGCIHILPDSTTLYIFPVRIFSWWSVLTAGARAFFGMLDLVQGRTQKWTKYKHSLSCAVANKYV